MAKGNIIRDGLLAFLAFFGFLLLIGGTGLAQGDVSNFFAGKSAQLKAQRMTNAAMVLTSVPEGEIRIEMSGYKVKLNGGERKIAAKKAGKEREVSFSSTISDYDSFSGPTSFESAEGTVCVRKVKSGGEKVLQLETGC